ncbi:MAG: NFACT family protein [Chloroflexia bacterium]
MPFDALTIGAVRREIEQKAVGGRVQGVLAAAPLTIGLEVYRSGVGRTFLLLSAHPQLARVHFTPTAPSRDPLQQPPLLLLLRKYVRGGLISGLSQPPFERVLMLSIAKRLGPGKRQEYHSDPYFMDSPTEQDDEEEDLDAPLTTVDLVIEIMGRLSNIVLVEEDGTVMDSIKRIPSSINRYRVILPHHPYVPPPPQDKRDPLSAGVSALSLELQTLTGLDPTAPAWKALVSGFAAVSPTLAREVVFRALGDAQTPAAEIAVNPTHLEKVQRELRALLNLDHTAAFTPTVAWQPLPEGRKALDFAPYTLEHLAAKGANLETCATISEAASRYYTALESLSGHSALVAQARADLADLRSRDERRVAALRGQLTRAEAAEQLRRKGEFLLAYMHTLTPGQTTLSIPDENLTIELDPDLTPVANAQAFFKEYHKARSAQAGLPALLERAEMQVRYLDELETSLDLASGYDEIRAVQSEIKQARSPSGPERPTEASAQPNKQQRKPRGNQEKLPQPLRLKTHSGLQMLVGRTARQNDAATFRLASPDDLWFHARGVPGSHVILRTAGAAEPTEDDIREAASQAAARSRAREEAQVDVIYTPKRNVRKVPNSPPGFVTVRHEQVVRVAPAKAS